MSDNEKKQLNVLLIESFFMAKYSLIDLLARKTDRREASFTIPQGLLAIAAMSKKLCGDISLDMLDMNKELYFFCKDTKRIPTSITCFIDDILENQVTNIPDVVGISVNFSTGHDATIILAQVIKKRWQNVKVVVGGNHATSFTAMLLKESSIDYVIRGQGDYSFPEFLNALSKGKDPSCIQGVMAEPDKTLWLSPRVSDLDDLPTYDYDLLDMETYLVDTGRTIKTSNSRTMSYLFSRGCAFGCTFCSSHNVHSRRVVTKSSKKSINELKELVDRYGVNTIVVEDDLFGANRKIFYEFCDKYQASGLKLRFLFPNAFSVAVLDEKMIDRLIDIGMKNAALAVESGSKYVQKKIIKKNCNLEKAVRIAKYLREKSIELSGYFILGFPGETKEMMNETRIQAINMQLDWADFFLASPLVGSEMKDQLIASGVIKEKDFVSIINNTDFRVRLYDSPEISARELEAYVYDLNIQVNFFGNYNMQAGNFKKAIEMFSRIIESYHFHIVALACRARCYLGVDDVSSMENDHKKIDYLLLTRHPESVKLNNVYMNQIREFINETLNMQAS